MLLAQYFSDGGDALDCDLLLSHRPLGMVRMVFWPPANWRNDFSLPLRHGTFGNALVCVFFSLRRVSRKANHFETYISTSRKDGQNDVKVPGRCFAPYMLQAFSGALFLMSVCSAMRLQVACESSMRTFC